MSESAEQKQSLEAYAQPRLSRSLLDLATSVVPYLALTAVMYLTIGDSIWLTLGLAIPTAGFLLRTFIVFHDCGHGSFMPTKAANRWVGRFTALLVWQPYENWRFDHAVHHGTAGDLDRRGQGDVPTLTVTEYYEKPWQQRLGYRLFRNPLVMFGLGPIWSLMIGPRLSSRDEAPPASQQHHPHQHRARDRDHRALPGVRDPGLPPGPDPAGLPRRDGGCLAVLRPASVRGRLLGERAIAGAMTMRRSRAARI